LQECGSRLPLERHRLGKEPDSDQPQVSGRDSNSRPCQKLGMEDGKTTEGNGERIGQRNGRRGNLLS